MCGIVAGVATKNIVSLLCEGLKRVEYRGYDSAGIAVIDSSQQLQRLRVQGKVHELIRTIDAHSFNGNIGIAHTRWATHGAPSEANAHPHFSANKIALVHNGVVENYEILRDHLLTQGYEFTSQTDSEVVTHLLHYYYKKQDNFLSAFRHTVAQLQGAFALVVMCQADPQHILVACHGAPLAIGVGHDAHFVGSDVYAIAHVAHRVCYLEEGDIASITAYQHIIYQADGAAINRPLHKIDLSYAVTDPGKYRHHMRKEIFDQPSALEDVLEGRIEGSLSPSIFGDAALDIFHRVEHVQLVACGTSYYAGLLAAYWLESLAGIHAQAEIASEFRYRQRVTLPNSLLVTLSQSGETADTLAALRHSRSDHYLASLTICNVPHSTLVRESDLHFMTRAGIEVGVASTKAFTAQLVSMLLFTVIISRKLSAAEKQRAIAQIKSLPRLVEDLLKLDNAIAQLAAYFIDKQHALFLGRGAYYPIALEGALKLKELSYIHAEAYPAGELKHGPLALVDRHMPVVAIAPDDEQFSKLRSNLHEVCARGGDLIIFTDNDALANEHAKTLRLPTVPALIAPIIYTIPLQLLAYHVAVLRGTDVDKPRNLAKSVTVE